eukprot:scaffold23497_cov106-Cylindrotheca_fusiformis.AAC.7
MTALIDLIISLQPYFVIVFPASLLSLVPCLVDHHHPKSMPRHVQVHGIITNPSQSARLAPRV